MVALGPAVRGPAAFVPYYLTSNHLSVGSRQDGAGAISAGTLTFVQVAAPKANWRHIRALTAGWWPARYSNTCARAGPLLLIGAIIASPAVLVVGLHQSWPLSPEPDSLVSRWTVIVRWAELVTIGFAVLHGGVHLGAGSGAAYAVVRGRTPLVFDVLRDAFAKAPSLLWLHLQGWTLSVLLWLPLVLVLTGTQSHARSTILVVALAVTTTAVTVWVHLVYLLMAPVFVVVQDRAGTAASRAARVVLPLCSRRTLRLAACYVVAVIASAWSVVGWSRVVAWLFSWAWPAGSGWDDILNREYLERVAYGLVFPVAMLVPCLSLVVMWLLSARVFDDATTARGRRVSAIDHS